MAIVSTNWLTLLYYWRHTVIFNFPWTAPVTDAQTGAKAHKMFSSISNIQLPSWCNVMSIISEFSDNTFIIGFSETKGDMLTVIREAVNNVKVRALKDDSTLGLRESSGWSGAMGILGKLTERGTSLRCGIPLPWSLGTHKREINKAI